MDVYTNVTGYLADRPEQAVAAVALFIVLGFVLRAIAFRKDVLAHIPRVGNQYGGYLGRLKAFAYKAESLYKEGYAYATKNSICRITTVDGERILVPGACLEELQKRPDSEVNAVKALMMIVEGKYTDFDCASKDAFFLIHLIKADLTHNLPRLNHRLYKEVERSFVTELPKCDDWTPVTVYTTLSRIIAIASGNIFLGPELCRRKEYLDSALNYVEDFFAAVHAIKAFPVCLRGVAHYFLPAVWKLAASKQRAINFFIPLIKERKKLIKEGKELPDDLMQWMLNKAEEAGVKNNRQLAMLQLAVTLGAIHTTSITATHIVFDLAVRPDVADELRAEIKEVLKASGGEFTTHALYEMKLLDSVMRESQRFNPLDMTRFARFIEKSLTLKDGTFLPGGYVIEIPHIALNRDETLYPDADTWDPYRFLKLRKGESPDVLNYKSKEQYQFVSASKENLSFGLGRHVCPGRFFAANEIKLILSRLLLDFDFKMPDGLTQRYDNVPLANTLNPKSDAQLLFKKRPAEARV